jgi:hypothetical protein
MAIPGLDPGAGGGVPGLGDFLAPRLYDLLRAALAAALGQPPPVVSPPPPARPLAQPGQGREAIEAPPRDEWSPPPYNPQYPFTAPVYPMPNMPYDPSTGTYRPTWGNMAPGGMAPPGLSPDDPIRGRNGREGAPWWTPAPLPRAPVYSGGHIPGPPQPVPPIGSRDPRAWARWEADMRRYRAQYDVY